ncbi:monomeric sarcosine oxidase-like [Patiria miniata]|uniref:FAD dependent oxidoreductase domain-containing protein n=1 Tax=Patiria miniata TaxID=46514 RepID=A0A914B376_PATMI|nr:monomeric sarcosine oxidase-like [Patiria miniata]
MSGADRWYEYVVVGCGGIGSSAVYWLAKRAGQNVLGLEQFKLGHDHGGSQDHSRIIRLSYSDPLYTKLAAGAYACWDEVEKESGLQLVYKTGGINFSRRGGLAEKIVDRYAESMQENDIEFENLDGLRLHERFPQFSASDNYRAVYQKDSGLVDAALANAVHTQLARKHGATILEETKVERFEKTKDGSYRVFTNRGTFRCRRLIITAGAWLKGVLSSVGVQLPLTVTQEQVLYLATPNISEFTKSRYPIWIYHTDNGDFYGMPIHGNSGVKIGVDVGGDHVTVETRTYIPNQTRLQQCLDFSREHIPGSLGPILYAKTCLYTMPPDRHFVIDTCHRTNHPDAIVCCGAGHAFKFASVLGRVLSELSIDGRTEYDISAFNLGRPALHDPSFKPLFQLGITKLQEAKL